MAKIKEEDTVEKAFPYTEEGFRAYQLWFNQYNNQVFSKYGRHCHILSTKNEIILEGERMVVVKLETRLDDERKAT